VYSDFKRVSQDAVVQVGWRLELTPLRAGKGCGRGCPELKLTSGEQKSDGLKGGSKVEARGRGKMSLTFRKTLFERCKVLRIIKPVRDD
ncbi:unnamed protein product, partial [Tetraodon nigroviridis]